MRLRTSWLLVLLIPFAGCSRPERTFWSSTANAGSPYQATLYQTVYNAGETTIYAVKFERTDKPATNSSCGGGFFVKKELEGDIPAGPRPQIQWTSPHDLSVVVATEMIEGQVVQHFHDMCGPDGSLTIVYKTGHGA